MRHTAWECCLHHCSCRREKQVQPRQAFITLLEKKFHVTLITPSMRGETCRDVLTQTENRAGTQKANRSPFPQENEYSWSIKKFGITSRYEETKQPNVTSERQNPDTPLDPRCQSGPSTRNSLDPKEGRFSKDYGADRQRLQISDPHFDKFLHPATFACWKIRFKTEACTCSQFPTEAMLCIKRSGDG